MLNQYKGHIFQWSLVILCAFCSEKAYSQPISLSANRMKSIQFEGHSGQRLIGNVQFEQQGSRVYCDEAEYDPQSETLKGLGSIRIVNAEGGTVTGKQLFFDNKTHIARVEGDVNLTDKSMTLSTPWLQYNTLTRVGWYGSGGTIIDKNTKLTSLSGSYDPKKKTMFFKRNVLLQTPEYVVKTDTLQYNSETKVAKFFSFTQMEYESQTMVFERGNYNTETETGQFYQKFALFDKNKTLIADSISMNKRLKSGTAFGKVWMIDSNEHWQLWGTKASYAQNTGQLWITGKPMAMQVDKKDSFFLKSDTLYYFRDSLRKKQEIKALQRVRFLRGRTLGSAATMIYHSSDSTFRLRGMPVLWDSMTRMSGDSINLHLKKQKLQKAALFPHAFIAIEEGHGKYSQISGDSMTHYMDSNQRLIQTWVHRKGKSVYYLRENDTISSAFDVTCEHIRFNFNNGKIDKVHFFVEPEGHIYPLDQFPGSKAKLEGFKWDVEYRPKRREFYPPHAVNIPKLGYTLNSSKKENKPKTKTKSK